MSGPEEAERMATVLSTIAVQARRTNLVRAAAIRTALQRSAAGELDTEGWAAAERTAHQLAGSAGTFGYSGASDLARVLESRLADFTQDGAAAPSPAQLTDALGLLDRLSEQLTLDPDLD